MSHCGGHKQPCARSAPVYDSMMTGRICKQLCTSGMLSGGLNENWRTGRNFLNVLDQIVTSSSEVNDSRFWFDVYGSMHHKYIPIYIQQDATLHSLFISGNCSTCFGCCFLPSSRARTTGLSVLWVVYATHSMLKPVPTLPQ